MPSKKKKYNARFPAGRIKKIMQTDEEVGKVAQAVPIIISRTLELFVESLLKKSMLITNSKNAKTLSPSHMKQCILSESRFDFLKDLVSSIPDVSASDEITEPVTPCIEPSSSTSGMISVLPVDNLESGPSREADYTSYFDKDDLCNTSMAVQQSFQSSGMDLSKKSELENSSIGPNFYKEISPPEFPVHNPVPSVIQYSPKTTEIKNLSHSVQKIIQKPNKIPKLNCPTFPISSTEPFQYHIDLSKSLCNYEVAKSPAISVESPINLTKQNTDSPVFHLDLSKTICEGPPPLIPIFKNSKTSTSNSLNATISKPHSLQDLDEDYDN